MKTKFLILATIAVAMITFSNNANALEIRTYKDHTNDPDYGLLKRDIEVIFHEKEEITEEKLTAILREAITPKDKSVIIDEDNLNKGSLRVDFSQPFEYSIAISKYELKQCIKDLQSTTSEYCQLFDQEGMLQVDLLLPGIYKNLTEWYYANYPNFEEFADLRTCDPRPIEISGCNTLYIKFTVDRNPLPQENPEPITPPASKVPQNSGEAATITVITDGIQAPNTGFSGGSQIIILPAATLLAVATFILKPKK